jgi:hypothetical protein
MYKSIELLQLTIKALQDGASIKGAISCIVL